jgi:hypothetical protein
VLPLHSDNDDPRCRQPALRVGSALGEKNELDHKTGLKMAQLLGIPCLESLDFILWETGKAQRWIV